MRRGGQRTPTGLQLARSPTEEKGKSPSEGGAGSGGHPLGVRLLPRGIRGWAVHGVGLVPAQIGIAWEVEEVGRLGDGGVGKRSGLYGVKKKS